MGRGRVMGWGGVQMHLEVSVNDDGVAVVEEAQRSAARGASPSQHRGATGPSCARGGHGSRPVFSRPPGQEESARSFPPY